MTKDLALTDLEAASSIIFDLDGTLFDTAGDIHAALVGALQSGGHPAPAEAVVRQGLPLREMVRAAIGPDADIQVVEQVEVEFRKRYDASNYNRTTAYPGIPELVHRLHASGKALHIATNKRRVPTLRILECKGFTNLFRSVVCVDQDGGRLTKREMLEHILCEDDVPSAACMFLGDSVGDIKAGKAAGIKTVGVLYGYAPAEEIVASEPDLLCKDVAGLL